MPETMVLWLLLGLAFAAGCVFAGIVGGWLIHCMLVEIEELERHGTYPVAEDSHTISYGPVVADNLRLIRETPTT